VTGQRDARGLTGSTWPDRNDGPDGRGRDHCPRERIERRQRSRDTSELRHRRPFTVPAGKVPDAWVMVRNIDALSRGWGNPDIIPAENLHVAFRG